MRKFGKDELALLGKAGQAILYDLARCMCTTPDATAGRDSHGELKRELLTNPSFAALAERQSQPGEIPKWTSSSRNTWVAFGDTRCPWRGPVDPRLIHSKYAT